TSRIFALQYGWRLGISHEEAEGLFNEAEGLASRAGDVRSRVILLMTYAAVRGVSHGDVREFAKLGRQAFALAEEAGDPALYMAIVGGAYAFFCTGEHREAVAMVDRALELADGDPTVGAGVNYDCPYAWCHGFKGMVLASLGELEEARHLIDQAEKLAREQGDIEVVGMSHLHAMYLEYFAGEPAATLSHSQQALEIAERIGNSFARAAAWLGLGLAEQMRGEWQRAIGAFERSITVSREGRTAVDGAILALLGDSYLGLGDPERARALVAEGLETARAQGNVTSETFASLARARVLLGSGGPREEIEAALAQALELACDTEAKALK